MPSSASTTTPLVNSESKSRAPVSPCSSKNRAPIPQNMPSAQTEALSESSDCLASTSPGHSNLTSINSDAPSQLRSRHPPESTYHSNSQNPTLSRHSGANSLSASRDSQHSKATTPLKSRTPPETPKSASPAPASMPYSEQTRTESSETPMTSELASPTPNWGLSCCAPPAALPLTPSTPRVRPRSSASMD